MAGFAWAQLRAAFLTLIPLAAASSANAVVYNITYSGTVVSTTADKGEVSPRYLDYGIFESATQAVPSRYTVGQHVSFSFDYSALFQDPQNFTNFPLWLSRSWTNTIQLC